MEHIVFLIIIVFIIFIVFIFIKINVQNNLIERLNYVKNGCVDLKNNITSELILQKKINLSDLNALLKSEERIKDCYGYYNRYVRNYNIDREGFLGSIFLKNVINPADEKGFVDYKVDDGKRLDRDNI